MYIEIKADMGWSFHRSSFDYLFYFDTDDEKYYSEDVLILNDLYEDFMHSRGKKADSLNKKIGDLAKKQERISIEKERIETLIDKLKAIDLSKVIFERVDACFLDGWHLTFKISSDRNSIFESNALSLKLHCPDSSKSTSETKKLYELCKEFCHLAGDDTLHQKDLDNERSKEESKQFWYEQIDNIPFDAVCLTDDFGGMKKGEVYHFDGTGVGAGLNGSFVKREENSVTDGYSYIGYPAEKFKKL